MARTPTYPLGLPTEQRARWEKEAKKRKLSLAEFIRQAVERDIQAAKGTHGYPRVEVKDTAELGPAPTVAGKVFKGPDPKVKPRPSSR